MYHHNIKKIVCSAHAKIQSSTKNIMPCYIDEKIKTSLLFPTPLDYRSSRIPRTNNHILILLQPYQPPTTSPHPYSAPQSPSHHPPHNSFPSIPVTRENDTHACARTDY